MMTHTLDTFTELLPARPSLDEMKADFLRDAEAMGIADYLRARSLPRDGRGARAGGNHRLDDGSGG